MMQYIFLINAWFERIWSKIDILACKKVQVKIFKHWLLRRVESLIYIAPFIAHLKKGVSQIKQQSHEKGK